MPMRIEDYALIGDTRTTAFVARDGSVDWLCLPRFDSSAPFAALLGTSDKGRFSVASADGVRCITRTYRGDTLVLQTDFETEDGDIRLFDFMPPGVDHPSLVRIVQGLSGRVPVHLELVIRFQYGSETPWVRREGHALVTVAATSSNVSCRGYEGSRPVRVGNAAIKEFQLDIYGEVMDALLLAREAGVRLPPHTWEVQLVLMKFLESAWHRQDQGMWESRGPARHFTHSKVLAWAAFDRAHGRGLLVKGSCRRWRVADEIRREVENVGFIGRSFSTTGPIGWTRRSWRSR